MSGQEGIPALPAEGAAPQPRCGRCGGTDFTSSFAFVGVAGSGYLIHCAGCGTVIGFASHVLTRLEQEIIERIQAEVDSGEER